MNTKKAVFIILIIIVCNLTSCEFPDEIPEKYNNTVIIKKTTIVSDEYVFQSLEHMIFQHISLIDVYADSLSEQQLNQYPIDDGLLFWSDPFNKQWATFQYDNYRKNKGIINGMISISMDKINMKTQYHIDINGIQFKHSGNSNTYFLEGFYTMSQMTKSLHTYNIHSNGYTGINNAHSLSRKVHYNITTENDETIFQGDTVINNIQNIAIIGESRYNEHYYLAIPLLTTIQNCNDNTLPISGKWKITGIQEPVYVTFGLNEENKPINSCDAAGYRIEWPSNGKDIDLFIEY